jgi:hypothetical protein
MANYTDIDIMPEMTPQFEFMVGDLLYQMNSQPAFTAALALWSLGIENMEVFVKSKQIRELLNDKKGFDLVISEAFMNEPVYGFAHYFKVFLFNSLLFEILFYYYKTFMVNYTVTIFSYYNNNNLYILTGSTRDRITIWWVPLDELRAWKSSPSILCVQWCYHLQPSLQLL